MESPPATQASNGASPPVSHPSKQETQTGAASEPANPSVALEVAVDNDQGPSVLDDITKIAGHVESAEMVLLELTDTLRKDKEQFRQKVVLYMEAEKALGGSREKVVDAITARVGGKRTLDGIVRRQAAALFGKPPLRRVTLVPLDQADSSSSSSSASGDSGAEDSEDDDSEDDDMFEDDEDEDDEGDDDSDDENSDTHATDKFELEPDGDLEHTNGVPVPGDDGHRDAVTESTPVNDQAQTLSPSTSVGDTSATTPPSKRARVQ